MHACDDRVGREHDRAIEDPEHRRVVTDPRLARRWLGQLASEAGNGCELAAPANVHEFEPRRSACRAWSRPTTPNQARASWFATQTAASTNWPRARWPARSSA